MIYYSFESHSGVEMPTDYDLIFQRYTLPLDAGGGEILYYTVTGVLLAPGVEAVVADSVDIDNVPEADYSDRYSEMPLTIGHEWKIYDFEEGWLVDDDRAQFVKLKSGKKYKLVFYDFEGSSTGTSTLERTAVQPTSIYDREGQPIKIKVFPNPAVASFTIEAANADNYRIRLFNSAGQIALYRPVCGTTQIDLPSGLISGTYYLSIEKNQQRQIIPVQIGSNQ